MRKSWLLCVLLGTLSWGQAAPSAPPQGQPLQAPEPGTPAPAAVAKPPAPPAQGPTAAVKLPAAPADTSAAVPDNAAVITVLGVCPTQPKTTAAKGTAAKPATAPKTPAADCKTVVTKAEFELLLKGIPNGNMQKRNIAGRLPQVIAMSNEAEKRGLDKKPEFGEVMRLVRMQVLAAQLQQKIAEDAAKISEEDIADYYKKNPEAYEQYNLERLFVPRTKQVQAEAKEEKEEEKKEEKLTEEQQKAKQAEEKAKQEENEQAMAKAAESLRARAAAGEDFTKLQKEAYDEANFKIEAPNVTVSNARRAGLPPAHAAVFDLQPGEVSQVINDAGGHYIYKMKSKDQLPLDQVREEIHRILQTQKQREMMDKLNNSFKVETNEAYFGPAGPGPGMQPPARMPSPRMAPRPMPMPMPPETQPQTPPPAQAPAGPQAQPQPPPAPKPN
jgi:bifunctional DNA-binding transcriptional regulator/antitoxin component of YhaV-PrlF toxin-antitoxin module